MYRTESPKIHNACGGFEEYCTLIPPSRTIGFSALSATEVTRPRSIVPLVSGPAVRKLLVALRSP